MPGMLPGMQALHHFTSIWLAAVLHVLPVAELCAAVLNRVGPSAPGGGGALVVGTVKVPPLLGGSTLLRAMPFGAAL